MMASTQTAVSAESHLTEVIELFVFDAGMSSMVRAGKITIELLVRLQEAQCVVQIAVGLTQWWPSGTISVPILPHSRSEAY